ncbi:uncharacterized protein LOC124999288 isoform X2 [Mugil cephalus]|uniref:uncharacterized protein LOC124999288 isoform X2 n=1 Tax=Mugil cephalus TaxID=48193 RepID=UPI001FB734E6|nr:uncharacterized protein LOC124999288 isoform X2 [Mugil cephalus]
MLKLLLDLFSSICVLLYPSSVQRSVLRNFHIYCTGRTNGAHQFIVQKIKNLGQTEVMPFEDCDYLLVFCPITSRVGTDISEAMDRVSQGYGNKPIILVVMHHTFDPEHVVAESGRHVENTNVLLTVDTLFYEDKLLNCKRNEIALDEIKKSLPLEHYWTQTLTNWWNKIVMWGQDRVCSIPVPATMRRWNKIVMWGPVRVCSILVAATMRVLQWVKEVVMWGPIRLCSILVAATTRVLQCILGFFIFLLSFIMHSFKLNNLTRMSKHSFQMATAALYYPVHFVCHLFFKRAQT